MPKKQQKMASNEKMYENKSTLKFNFTIEYAKCEIVSDPLRCGLHAKNFAASYLLETCA